MTDPINVNENILMNVTLQPKPFEIIDGPQIAYGQITLGYCVGIRFEAHSGKWVDAIVFAPSPEDVERALSAFTITKTCYGSTNAPRAIMDATKLKPMTSAGEDMEQAIAAGYRRGMTDGFAKGKAFENERIGKILGQYGDGQWWVGELESLVNFNGTIDQRRAVNGVLLSLLAKIGDLFSGQEFSEVAKCSTAEREPTTWSRYVASMVGCYLGWGVDDKRIETIAGIIERRRWCEPKVKPAEPFLTLREAERVADLPAVDEAIRALLADNTGDNAVALVQTILESVRDQNLKPGAEGDPRK